MVPPERAPRCRVGPEELAVHTVRNDPNGGPAHERRLGERSPRELLGQEHGQPHPAERQPGEQVSGRSGRADAVDHGEGPAQGRERRVSNVTRSVHEHDIGGEIVERPSQRSRGLEIGVTDGKRLYGELLAPESSGDRLIGRESGRGVSPCGEPTPEDGEDRARAPPEAARGQEGNAQGAGARG